MSPQKRFDPAAIPDIPDLSHEIALWSQGATRIAGIDEAGRGALAGPVSVGAVILPADRRVLEQLNGVRDSKQMSPKERAYWKRRIEDVSIAHAVGFATNIEIDEIGIVPSVYLAARRALDLLCKQPQHLLVDFFYLTDISIPQTPLIKGDARSLSIAAASILAKTARDACMDQRDMDYPVYGFKRHKGYGTQAHRDALLSHGPCPLHRMSYRLPCKVDQEI